MDLIVSSDGDIPLFRAGRWQWTDKAVFGKILVEFKTNKVWEYHGMW